MRRRGGAPALAAVAVLASLFASPAARAGTVTRETFGERSVRIYVPDRLAEPRALVVMLHGCTQTPDDFADATRMDAVADEGGFVVAYPEQPESIMPARCFRWYDPAHQTRGSGEPKELADAAQAIASARGVDHERVYVAGISAGAAMSVVLGATYPDRFAAIGVVAGLEYAAASSLAGTVNATNAGGPDPAAQGDLARRAMGPAARALAALVINGDADGVVAPVNGDQVTAQWLRTDGLLLGDGAIAAPQKDTGEAGYSFTRELHPNAATGGIVVEHVVVAGLGHAWPGGRDGGSYADPKGPDASRMLWAFFRDRTLSFPFPPPAASDADADAGAGASASPAPGAPSDDGHGGCSQSGRAGASPWLATLLALAFAARRRKRAVTDS